MDEKSWLGLFKRIICYFKYTSYDDAKNSKENITHQTEYYLSKKVESVKFIYNIWRQTTFAFNNGYGERLIFESLN